MVRTEERNTFPICSENLRLRLAPAPYADAKGKDGGRVDGRSTRIL